MTDPIRSALKRLLSAVLDGLGQDDHPMGWARVDDAIDAARAALAAEPVAVSDRLPELRGMFERILCVARSSDQKPVGNIELADRLIKAVVSWGTSGAALAEPVAEGPTDEELLELWQGWNLGWDPRKGMVLTPHPAEYARAVLARWGRPAPAPAGERQAAPVPAGEVAELVVQLRGCADDHFGATSRMFTRAADLLERQAAPVPVAVSERLPQPEDCDAEGRCWWFSPLSCYGSEGTWELMRTNGNTTGCTHWLPANALPLPQGEVEE